MRLKHLAFTGKSRYAELISVEDERDLEAKTTPKSHWYSPRNAQAWRPIVCSGIFLSAAVMLVNTTILVIGLHKQADSDGARIFYEGNCDTASRINTVWHILINVLR